jgi:HEAT repeat protein
MVLASNARLQVIQAPPQADAGPSARLRPVALELLKGLSGRLDVGPLSLERLARDGDTDARRALETLATEGRTPAAVAALIRLGDAGQLEAARQLLGDRMLNDPIQLFSALERMKATTAAPALLPWLAAPEYEIASAAALALGRLGYRPAAQELRSVMATPNPLLRPAAAAALWRMGERDVQQDLEGYLTSSMPEIRLLAAAAWAPETDGPWRSAITPLLSDQHPPRRIAAARLLETIDPASARRAMANDIPSLEDPQLRSEAAAVFEDVATLADGAILAEALKDPDTTVQIHAAGAVLRVTRAGALR